MKRHSLVVLLVVLAALFGASLATFQGVAQSASAGGLPMSPIVRVAAFFGKEGELGPSAPLTGGSSLGSGVVVSEDGYILTNSHVICDRGGSFVGCSGLSEEYPQADFVVILCTVEANRPPVALYVAEIVRESRLLDVALLKVTGRIELQTEADPTVAELLGAVLLHTVSGSPIYPSMSMFAVTPTADVHLPVAPLGDPTALVAGDPVSVRGYPRLSEALHGYDQWLFQAPGWVDQLRADEGFIWIADAFTTFGSSGGAVLSEENGALVGIVCGTPDYVQTHAGRLPTQARSVDILSDLLPENVVYVPTARFSYSPSVPTLGRRVSFDGTLSSTPQGEIVSYEWDLDGDGEFERFGATVNERFEALPSPRVALRVTNSKGCSDTVTQVIPLQRKSGFDEECCQVCRGDAVLGEYDSLQQCLDQADDGDTVKIEPGLYPGGLFVAHGITLEPTETDSGERVVIEGDGVSEVIRVEGAVGAILEGIRTTNGAPGVIIEGCRDVVIRDCEIVSNLSAGLQVIDSSGSVERCLISSTTEGCLGEGGNGLLIEGDRASSVLVSKCSLEGNVLSGIAVRSQTVELRESRVEGNRRWGIDVDSGGRLNVIDTAVSNNRGYGIYVGDAHVEIAGGAIEATRALPSVGQGDGIYVSEAGVLDLAACDVMDNEVAGVSSASFVPSVVGETVATVAAEGVNLSGNLFGILCQGLADVALTNSTIGRNGFRGVLAGGAAEISMNGCTVSDSLRDGIEASGASRVLLTASRVSENTESGLVLRDYAEATCVGSAVQRNSTGGAYPGSPAVLLEDESSLHLQSESLVLGNAGVGIRVANEASLTMRGGAVISCNGAAGLEVVQSGTAVLEKAVVVCNRGNGVDLLHEATMTATDSWFSDNEGFGLSVVDPAVVSGCGNILIHNLEDPKAGALPDGFAATPGLALRQSIDLGEGEVASLWDAVRLVESGGTIELPAGSWAGGLIITKPLTIAGDGMDSSEISGSLRDGLRVVGEGNLTLSDIGITNSREDGIQLVSNSTQTQSVVRCGLYGNREGVVCGSQTVVRIAECDVLSNLCHGIWGQEESTVWVEGCRVSGNTLAECSYGGGPGVVLGPEAQGAVEFVQEAVGFVAGSVIESNHSFGVEAADDARVTLIGNAILGNDRWGVIQIEAPCFAFPEGIKEQAFDGIVEGRGNRIEGNGTILDPEALGCGDGIGDVCPAGLEFLKE